MYSRGDLELNWLALFYTLILILDDRAMIDGKVRILYSPSPQNFYQAIFFFHLFNYLIF